jgi:hypothetical protein
VFTVQYDNVPSGDMLIDPYKRLGFPKLKLLPEESHSLSLRQYPVLVTSPTGPGTVDTSLNPNTWLLL